MIVGFQHLAVALADRHAAVGAFGVFRQLKERVPVLIELQADLAEEFCQLVGGPAHAIHVGPKHPFIECFGGFTDRSNTSLQYGSQAQLMFTGEAAHELQHIGIELQIAAARQGLQDVRIDQGTQYRALRFGIPLPGYLGNTVQHLIAGQHGKLARQPHQKLHGVPMGVKRVDQRARVGHVSSVSHHRAGMPCAACSHPPAAQGGNPAHGRSGVS